MPRLQQWLPIAFLMLLVALTFWLNQVVQNSPAARNSANTKHEPKIIIDNFSARSLSASGEVQYVLKAKQMQHFDDDSSSQLTDVKLVAQMPNRPQLTATAANASILDAGSEITLKGDVLLLTQASAKLPALKISTPKLTILPDENIAKSVDGAVLEGAKQRTTMSAFTLNNEKRTFEMRNMRVVMEPRNK
jgi:lipopolysaccharide export system protein LptC